MAFIRAQGIESANAENANHAAEDICLLEIEVEKVLGALFNEIDGVLNVNQAQARGQRNGTVKSIRTGRHR